MKISFKNSLFVFLLLLQIFFAAAYLPVGEWFSDSLIYSDDFTVHYSAILTQNELIDDYGSLWGYLPFFRAGSVTQTLLSIDSKGWGIAVKFLSVILSKEAAFKIAFILSIILIPFILYFAGKNLKFGDREILMLTAGGLLYLQTSICVDFIKWGTISFVFASFLSLYAVSLFYSYLDNGGVKKIIGATLISCLAVWVHLLAIICIAVPLFFFIASYLRGAIKKKILPVSLSGVVILFVTLPIYYPLFLFYENRTRFFPWEPYYTSSLWEPVKTYIFQMQIFNEYYGIPFQKNSLVDILILLFAIAGFMYWKREKNNSLLICFAGAFAAFFFIGFYGSFFEFTRRLTPLRFLITMNIFLLPPAVKGASGLYDCIVEEKKVFSKAPVLIISLFFAGTLLAMPYYHFYALHSMRLNTSSAKEAQKLVNLIENNTTPEGRILMENSDWESGHVYFGGHFPIILPHYVDREYVGCEYSTDPMIDNFMSFYDGFLFHKKLDWFNRERIEEYCDLYNINWVICWSEGAVELMDSFPDYIKRKDSLGRLILYEVNRKGSYFLKGSGAVKTSVNNIELSNLTPEDGKVIISYHWLKTLKSDNSLDVQRAFLSDDKIGFIEVDNPPDRLRVYNAY